MIEEHEPAELSPQVVAQKVAEYLRHCRPDGISLEVDPNSVRWEGSWWRVRIRPSQEPPQLFRFSEALAGIEAALEEREHLKVFLTPDEPQQAPADEGEPPAVQPSPHPGAPPRFTKQAVAEKVAAYLRDCHPGGVTLHVDSRRLYRQDRVWRILVRPDAEPSNLMEYYEALADLEIKLEEREQLKVWLITADPEPPSPAAGCSPGRDQEAPGPASVDRRTRQPEGTMGPRTSPSH